jgi:hypothetical protein
VCFDYVCELLAKRISGRRSVVDNGSDWDVGFVDFWKGFQGWVLRDWIYVSVFCVSGDYFCGLANCLSDVILVYLCLVFVESCVSVCFDEV